MTGRRVGGTTVLALIIATLASGPAAPGAGPEPRVRVIVRLVDPTPRARLLLDATTLPLTLEARHELVVDGLQRIHDQALALAAPALDDARAAGALVELDRLWIVNALVAEVDPAWIARLEAESAIASIVPDARLVLDVAEAAPMDGVAAGIPTPEIMQIRVHEAWTQGITGRGAIVANVDTGVNGQDDTLKDKWRGLVAGPEAAWFSPHDLTVFPVDDDPRGGHGTASMGILAGGDQSFGVAYEATWIAGDIFRDARFAAEGYVSTALKTLQWASDPDGDPSTATDVPDVVSNSYGLDLQCDPIFNEAIDALEAAGAIVIWSAGNEGQRGPGSVTSPGNRATSPVNAFAVGAIGDNGVVMDFSGRGPSPCGGPHATKPEVVAPGETVPTRNRSNQSASFTGTSFATPMVGGVLALMRSKNPTITPEAAKTILLETARDIDAPGDDNNTGRGLIDAAAALARVESPSQPLARLVGFRPGGASAKAGPAPEQGGGALVLRPGLMHELAPLLTNHGPAIPASTATLSSPTPGVRVTRSTIALPAAERGAFFGPAQGESFGVELDAGIRPGSNIVLALTVQGAAIGPFRMAMKAGEPVVGMFATHDQGRVRLSVTNFGALGYYTGSHIGELILRGEGFRFPPTSPNWLFHASFMAGTAADRLSDAIPYGEDAQNETDFFPVYGQPLVIDQAAGAQRIVATYDDRHAMRPLGIKVQQETFAFGEAGESDFVILQYIVTNTTNQTLGGLRLGLFADWDLPGAGGAPSETAGWEPALVLGFVEGTVGQPALGVVWLDDIAPGLVTYAVVRRDSIGQSPRRGLVPAEAFREGEEFSDAEKWDALSSGQSRTSDRRPGDLWQVIGGPPIALAAGGMDTVAVALVAAESRAALQETAVTARETYFRRVLGTEPPPPPPPPGEIVLRQNFPNPFRPGQATAILYAVPEPGSSGTTTVELTVFDVAGRRVRTLVRGEAVPGEQAVTWDGHDDSGATVPAGVYVIRLTADGVGKTIRALLLP